MTDAAALYQDIILDHGKAPRNEGPLDGATHEATVKNPLCGDRVTVRVKLEGGPSDSDADAIRAIRFEARGCMIARASASLLTEIVAGKSAAEARALAERVEALVTGAVSADPALEALGGARAFPARRACVTLAWKALTSALAKPPVS